MSRLARWSPHELITERKDFGGVWVGSPALNRLGLHPLRIACSNLALAASRLQQRVPAEAEAFLRDGVVTIPGFLPAETFSAVLAEAESLLERLEHEHPMPARAKRGVRSEHAIPGGWDRCDGDTVSRFVRVDEGSTPACAQAVRDRRLARLCSFASGFRHRPRRFRIYRTVHGHESYKPDSQKHLHKDTFHSAVKLWLFLHDVELEHGPFEYVRGSHRMTSRRLLWEYRRAVAASRAPAARRGGAFRVSERELETLGLPPPEPFAVRANTLVLADVRGFHRRGAAAPGARRLALYANLRANPFVPLLV